jgi:hypothetical protein
MAVKAEIIDQFDGFGNLVPKSLSEHYRSSGFVRSANGMVAGRRLVTFSSGNPTKYPQSDYATIDGINMMADGKGQAENSLNSIVNVTYAMTDGGVIYQSDNSVGTPFIAIDIDRNNSHFSSGGIGGLIVDQKNRLLYSGQRYLGCMDPTANNDTATVTFTNGSGAIVATSGTFNSGMVGKHLMIFGPNSERYFYRLNAYTDSTHMTLYGTYGNTTGTYTVVILSAWVHQWKDWGTDYSINTEYNSPFTPTETYEDTVLFGRGNKITSLNTVTDTITTDASPAFTMPSGFNCLAIHKGSNGILIASNFQRKGVLILWDNFSDRSIAPWIQLSDRIVSVCKYNGGWLVITSREILYTNGYSVTPMIDSFLDSSLSIYSENLYPQSSYVIENELYCTLGASLNGKRRAGLYKINLTSKLATYIPRIDGDQYTNKTRCIFYSVNTGVGKINIGTDKTWSYLGYDVEPTVATFITNPVGKGENIKYAESLKVNLGISPTYSLKDSPLSFSVRAKICPMDKQIFNTAKLKTAMVTNYDKITVDETVYYNAKVGDEIEFTSGLNAGYSRNVISKTGDGTATAVLTLDSVLPNLDTNTTDSFFITSFQLIKTKTYTNITEIPEIFFDIKNKVKSKKFMIKIDIEGATLPIELKPMLFVYDDLGIL